MPAHQVFGSLGYISYHNLKPFKTPQWLTMSVTCVTYAVERSGSTTTPCSAEFQCCIAGTEREGIEGREEVWVPLPIVNRVFLGVGTDLLSILLSKTNVKFKLSLHAVRTAMRVHVQTRWPFSRHSIIRANESLWLGVVPPTSYFMVRNGWI